MKNISLQRECIADQSDIFFYRYKNTIYQNIWGKYWELFRKIQKFYDIRFHISIFLERWGILLLSEVIK